MPSNHLILCCPLHLLPSIFPSIRVFSNESVLHIRRPNCWSFSFNISPSNEYPELISFRMDWLDLLAGQGTLKSVLQHHSSKAPILRCSDNHTFSKQTNRQFNNYIFNHLSPARIFTPILSKFLFQTLACRSHRLHGFIVF